MNVYASMNFNILQDCFKICVNEPNGSVREAAGRYSLPHIFENCIVGELSMTEAPPARPHLARIFFTRGRGQKVRTLGVFILMSINTEKLTTNCLYLLKCITTLLVLVAGSRCVKFSKPLLAWHVQALIIRCGRQRKITSDVQTTYAQKVFGWSSLRIYI